MFEDALLVASFYCEPSLVARKRTRWRSHVDSAGSIFGVQECPGNVGIAASFPLNIGNIMINRDQKLMIFCKILIAHVVKYPNLPVVEKSQLVPDDSSP